MTVRVRIAPAPSGSIHVGNARTALFNWLFARQQGGAFIWRIEDTNQEKLNETAIASTADELRWMGLDWDEGPFVGGPRGPYRQSERLDTYRDAVDRLFALGLAYRCYCSPAELEERRRLAIQEGRSPGYDGRCRRLADADRARFEREGRGWVVRFRTPDEGVTAFRDAIAGELTFRNADLEDFPIMRQSGFPLYNLSVAVDDALMGITHAIRGMDIQSSTPRQILILRALDAPVPQYAHASLIVGPGGKKLSKRFGGDSVEWYRENGILPDALVNYLALLGMAYGDDTIVERAQLVERFDLSKVNPAPAALDQDKLDWMNGEYLRKLDVDGLVDVVTPWLESAGVVTLPRDLPTVRQLAPLLQTRIKRLTEAAGLCRPVFADATPDEAALAAVRDQPWTAGLAAGMREALAALEPWDREHLEQALRGVQEAMGLNARRAFVVAYVAFTGSRIGLPIFDVLALLGRDVALRRLDRFLALLGTAGTGGGAPTGPSGW